MTQSAFKAWRERHKNLWQFILFNILCNISTITRFVLVWAGTFVFVELLGMTLPFRLWIFDYATPESNGLGGFVTFLIAEVAAQVVNFIVQKTWVFKSDASFEQAAWKYAILAVVIVVTNLVLPGYVTSFLTGSLGMGAALASTLASVVNTLLAVIISWPALKYWIMPDSPKEAPAAQ